MEFSLRVKTSDKVAVALLCMASLLAATIPAYAQRAARTTAFLDIAPKPARYLVRMLQVAPPKLAVRTTFPINGKALTMERTRPGDVPEVGSLGWPALVRNLRVSDAAGRPIEVTSMSKAGWELAQPQVGRVTIEYEVDYSGLAAHGWPAPREAAFADNNHFVVVGRSVFITTPEVRASIVTFALPPDWRPVTPWLQIPKSKNMFAVAAAKDLVENLIVLTRSNSDIVTAGGFRLFITPMGHWQAASPEVNRVLRGVIPRFVRLMGFEERQNYSVVLLPILSHEPAGESYRGSFAFSLDVPPTRANRSSWGHTIAHEIFHYWNGWRMRGSDYASSQWFQEGFTDYAADVAMVGSGMVSADEFRQQLSKHINNYRDLATALDAPGSKKGPPLYSGGALVAFCWDVQIRHATRGKRNLGDFLRALWRQTNGGQGEYDWRDIQAALDTTARLDWDAFFRSYIRGTEKLPLDEVLHQAGLRPVLASDGSSRIEMDPLAHAEARSLWRALVAGR